MRLPLLSAAVAVLSAAEAQGQTTSRWGTQTAANSGNWSTAANWTLNAPTGNGAAGRVITLLGAGATAVPANQPTITTVQDLGATNYSLSQIFLANNATGGASTNPTINQPTADYIINPGGTSGGALNFVAGTMLNPSGVGTTNNGTSIVAGSSSGRLQINVPIIANAVSALRFSMRSNNVNGGEIFFNGRLTGTARLVFEVGADATGAITTIQSSNNQGYSGVTQVNINAILYLGGNNSIGRLSAISLPDATSVVTSGTTTAAGYGIGETGTNQQHASIGAPSNIPDVNDPGNFLPGNNGKYSVGTNTGASTVLSGFDGTDTSLVTAGGLAGFFTGSHFGKVGGGNFSIQGLSASYNAGLSVRGGTLSINGNGGLISSVTTPAPISIYSGAQIFLSNDSVLVTNRLSNNADVRLVGGTLRLDGSGSTGSTEAMGTLRVLAGLSQAVINTSGQAAGFSFTGVNTADLTRGGQLALVASAGGTFTITGAVATSGILPWGLSQTDYVSQAGSLIVTTEPNTLLAYSGSTASPLTDFTGNTNTFANTNGNVLVNGAVPTATGTTNSLTLDAPLVLTGPLAITSGAVINRAAAGGISGGSITTTGRLYLNSSAAAFSITSPITAASFSKGGNGGASISSAITLSDTSPVVSVNAGTLNLAGATFNLTNPTPGRVVFQVAGGTLSGVSSINGTLRGNGRVVGNVSMTAGSLLGASSLSSDLITGAAPGALDIDGVLTLTGGASGGNGARLRFYLSSVLDGQYTQGVLTVNGLDLTQASAANPIVVQPHGINLNDSGNGRVYDFDNTQGYEWVLISSDTPIDGFAANKFDANSPEALANFTNNTPIASGAQFSVDVRGNNLVLIYNPVPEPMLLGVVALGVVALARRRKA
jgi:hypothetical protein